MSTPVLKHTPFHDYHTSAGAKMVDFAGWEMPILYRTITDEHNQTRNSGSLFERFAHGPALFHRQGRGAFPQ